MRTQAFGQNATDTYAKSGLKGHTSEDYGAQWDTPIPFCVDGPVYSVMNRDNPDPERYRAVFQLVDCGEIAYEVSYGHLDQIFVSPGDIGIAGKIMGTAGNKGEVFSNGRHVTREEKLAGSHAGTHLHGPQVRPCRKVRAIDSSKQYLADGNGVVKRDGFYFEVIDYGNGFNGCIDPGPLYNGFLATNAAKVRGLYKQLIVLLQLQYAELKAKRSA
jgi:murein DD-endopeptidase MepM/ murein hydrolase activator NlpD